MQITISYLIYKILLFKLNKVEPKTEEITPPNNQEIIDDYYKTIIPNYTPIKFVPTFEVSDKHKRNVILSLVNNIDIWYVKFDSTSSYFIHNKMSDKMYITVRKDLGETHLVVNSDHNSFSKEQNNYIQPLLHNLLSDYEKTNSIKQLQKNKSIDDDFTKIVNSVDLRDDKFDQLGI